jgi:ornithine cyclodeaminase/alanine dehydrogenase-like protein (mu-crystallin family)
MKPPFDVIVPAVEAACAAGPPEVLRAALGAVASRFLSVGTPRSIGLVAPPRLAELALAAHRVYFAPREIRSIVPVADARVTSLAEACACDIVCVADPDVAIDAAWIRRGTHLDVWAGTLDPAILAVAKLVVTERGSAPIWATLHELAGGIIDGRELDEITVFLSGSTA